MRSRRGRRGHVGTDVLQELVEQGRAQIVGPVGQELLSGIRVDKAFRKVRDALRAFDEPQLRIQGYEEAARLSNICRARGIAGSPVDFLICAVANLRDWQVFTTDRDFIRYSKVLPLRLYWDTVGTHVLICPCVRSGFQHNTLSFSILYIPSDALFPR